MAKDVTTTRTAAPESKDNEGSRGPVTHSGETDTNQGLASTEGREQQAKVVDERLERLNEQNRTGHDKNMKKIEEDAELAAKNSEKPATGREWNRNTPRIDEHGNKHWY